jgi:hypothetical protein
VIAAAMLKTWTGMTCPSLRRVLWASELFANGSLFSEDFARNALDGLPVEYRDVWILVKYPKNWQGIIADRS